MKSPRCRRRSESRGAFIQTPAAQGWILAVGFLLLPLFASAVTFDDFRQNNWDILQRVDMNESGRNADPDGDGVSNLLEFAFDLHPFVNSTNDVQVVPNGGHLEITFRRKKDVPELTFIAEVSSDLVTWASSGSDVQTISVVDQGTYELVTVRGLTATTSADRRFIRVRVEADFVDTDLDTLPDWWETDVLGDITYYGNPNDDSTDYDSLGLLGEFIAETDPWDWDCDGDTLSDGDEVLVYETNPRNPDTDYDGLPDPWEIDFGTDPLKNDAHADLDIDGLTNKQEYDLGTLANDSDTDNDGTGDGWELQYGFNPLVGDGNADPDNDGLVNSAEFAAGSNPLLYDTDGDSLSDHYEVVVLGTNPTSIDTDADGMPDAWEVNNGTNPLVADGTLDPDNDNLTSYEEFVYGTDPLNPDSDGDGLDDGDEHGGQTSGLMGDTDGDVVPDGWELYVSLTSPIIDNAAEDTDGDNMGRALEHLAGRDPTVSDSPVDTSTRELDVHTALEP